jgi:hypothetical protein
MTLSAGTRLGPYQIEEAIGAGGMREVYRRFACSRAGRQHQAAARPDAGSTASLARSQRSAPAARVVSLALTRETWSRSVLR